MAKKRKKSKGKLNVGMALLGAAALWYLIKSANDKPTGNYVDPTPQIPQLPTTTPAVQRPKRRVNAVYVD